MSGDTIGRVIPAQGVQPFVTNNYSPTCGHPVAGRWTYCATCGAPIDPEAVDTWRAYREVVRVLQDAADTGKYPMRGYVDKCSTLEGQLTYTEASIRHDQAWWAGQTRDKDSNLHPLAHAAARILCRLESIMERGEPKQ